jgi:hypothetical protein
MNVQELASLLIVISTAALFTRTAIKRRKRKGSFPCDNGCRNCPSNPSPSGRISAHPPGIGPTGAVTGAPHEAFRP